MWKTLSKAIVISFIKFFTKCGHPTDDNKKHFFYWELDQPDGDKNAEESEDEEPSPNPMQEKDSIINIRAKEKLLQRTSLQQTLLNIVGYILNVIALTIIALEMYPWSLGRQNTKFLIDHNLRVGFDLPSSASTMNMVDLDVMLIKYFSILCRQSLALDNITNTLEVWNALDDLTGIVHGPSLHYKKGLKFSVLSPRFMLDDVLGPILLMTFEPLF